VLFLRSFVHGSIVVLTVIKVFGPSVFNPHQLIPLGGPWQHFSTLVWNEHCQELKAFPALNVDREVDFSSWEPKKLQESSHNGFEASL
jgi:hypothetical protein